MSDETDVKKPRLQPINRTALQFMRYASQEHSAVVPSSLTKEDLTDPDLWAHVRPTLNAFDEIRIIPENGRYRAKVFITRVDGKNLRLELIEHQEFNEVKRERKASIFDIEQKGQLGWCIINTDTNEVVVKGVGKNEATALKALQAHRRSVED